MVHPIELSLGTFPGDLDATTPHERTSAPLRILTARLGHRALSADRHTSLIGEVGLEALDVTTTEAVTDATATELAPADVVEDVEAARSRVDASFQALTSDLVVETAMPEAVLSQPIAPRDITARERKKVFRGLAERERTPKFSVRPARLSDIDDMVDIDLSTFSKVYDGYDTESGAWRTEMKGKFVQRLETVGGEWMPVLVRDGKVVGFMTTCLTNKTPNDFVSWEDTTNNGTLEGTYDPNGKNGYVVTLSVLPEGTEGKDMLFVNQIGKMLREGIELGFFESRMPGFRTWAQREADGQSRAIEDYTGVELDDLAAAYFGEKIVRNGREVPRDSLLRLYDRLGCKLLKVVPNAYNDQQSMNYGVVCVYDGESLFNGTDLPFRIPQNKLTRWMLGGAMHLIGKSDKLTRKLF